MNLLRKDDNGLKLGPIKRMPKPVLDLDLVVCEPIDLEELEIQDMQEQICTKKE